MNAKGNLSKMRTEWDQPIRYWLKLGAKEIELNALINQKLQFRFTGNIYCNCCGKKTNKSFFQGFCFNCFQTAPEASECILRPELCQAQQGISRDQEWSERYCLAPHFVYLAQSSSVKVGVTRKSQIPTRWIDQGASKAVRIAKTNNRHQAGQIEVALKNVISDKTSWQRMLKNESFDGNFDDIRSEILQHVPQQLQPFLIHNDHPFELEYPHTEKLKKVKSIGFDKHEIIEGVLKGIKGQYLIFETGLVLNIRKHGGYEVELTI